jgi:photosystem II stability/assembly factor-like uncharacterized protein
MRLPYLAFFLALWPFLGVVAKGDEPKITTHEFARPPKALFFFDDSEVALAMVVGSGADGEIWRTESVGDKWERIEEFPKGQPYYMILHPTDKRTAVVLGRSKTSWITSDKGKTWKAFKTPDHPSRSAPIRFHATDSNRILFQSMETCDLFTGGCLGVVSLHLHSFNALHSLINADVLHRRPIRIDAQDCRQAQRLSLGQDDQPLLHR